MATPRKTKAEATAATAPVPAATWATVTTLKESPEVVMNFVAQHLYLGASEIFLYFDDPADPAFNLVATIPQVRATRCDDAHWAAIGQRSDRHQARQKANAQAAYGRATSDWIIHLDADEMISASRPVADILAEATETVLRLPPFEAMDYDKAGRNGRPSHFFRGPLPETSQGQRLAAVAYGPFEATLFNGMLSHAAGKFFVCTGRPGMTLSIHAPYEDGKRRLHADAPGMKLLHFHGGDYAHWRGRVDYRLSKGAYMGLYQSNRDDQHATLHATLSRLKEKEGEAGLKRFYRAVCTFGPEKRVLKRVGALHRENLWLDAKRAAVFGMSDRLTNIGRAQAGFEADVDWNGIAMRVVPDSNYAACLIARGEPVEADELAEVRRMVEGRKVLFYDVGANAGIYALTVAAAAKSTSKILAYEPNPEMQRRLLRNLKLNKRRNVTLRPVALGEAPGRAVLNVTSYGNLGQAALVQDGPGIAVDVVCLPDELIAPKGFDLSFMKIDVEGAEAAVLRPALAAAGVHWPDVIMLEHKSAEDWGMDLLAALAQQGYTPRATTRHNTFLHRERD
jgi:FkbM family methyltransferase